MRDNSTLDRPAEATIRLLRAVLDEARGVLRTATAAGEGVLLLDQTIADLQLEAERLAPDYQNKTHRNGPATG